MGIKENLHNQIYLFLAEKILAALNQSYKDHGMDLQEVYRNIGLTPNFDMGHFAFACFPLAKTCKTSPALISKTLAESFPSIDGITETKALGPYFNFSLSTLKYEELVLSKITDEKFFGLTLFTNPPKTMVEYSQPNTHKELHVGHMRNLCLGYSVSELLKYSGHETLTSTYPGDMGTHVAKCLWYLKNHNQEGIPNQNKGAWLGKMYSRGNIKLEDELGSDQEQVNRTQLTSILKELEAEKGEYYDLWQETREWSLDLMKTTYKWAQIGFDQWYFESQFDSSSLKLAKKYLKEGHLIESQGAIGMDLTDDKLGFCLIIKSDGTGLYATKDLELAQKKMDDFDLDKSIYVVDVRQALHFKQVFKILEKIGFNKASGLFHLQYDFVELPDGPMSSRKGNIIPLMDLISQMEETIKSEFLAKYKDEWPSEEIEKTASIIASGAIKYGMVRMDNNRKIVFEMKEWLKLDGETGPYLQYVHARICSLLNKLNFDQSQVDMSVLVKKEEILLMHKLSLFNSIIAQSTLHYKPATLCSYLFELGKLFNSFYAECPMGRADNEAIKHSRLALSQSVAKVINKGLSIIGVESPERM
jgi:arginyl-tRNA synthetase